jgi:N utilization substance protein B
MISRRSIRIKTMQALYAYEFDKEKSIELHLNTLKKNILASEENYLYIFHLFLQIADYIEKESDRRFAKHIKTDEDKNYSIRFLSNIYIKWLEQCKDIAKNTTKFEEFSDSSLVKKLYEKLYDSEAYKNYINKSKMFNQKDDSEIIQYLFNDIMMKDEDVHEHLSDIWSNWIDDAGNIVQEINNTLKKSKTELKLSLYLPSYIEKKNDLISFSLRLFTLTVNQDSKFKNLITPKLQNWEADRLATIDILLLKMALCELFEFENIPVKVTLNEYIDIAKEYSTARSGDFVNGVLDNIVKEQKSLNTIHKEGRGLVE